MRMPVGCIGQGVIQIGTFAVGIFGNIVCHNTDSTLSVYPAVLPDMPADKDPFVLQVHSVIHMLICTLIQQHQIHRIVSPVDRITLLDYGNRFC